MTFIKGYKMTKEHKKKIGDANKISQKGKHATEITRKKMSLSQIGKHNLSEESKKRIGKINSIKLKKYYKNNPEARKKLSNLYKGKKLSEEHKSNISAGVKLLVANGTHHFWKGGKSKEEYGLDWTEYLRTSIRKRDKFQCQLCFNNGFIVHHIDYDKKNNHPNNLITLCPKHHLETNSDRDNWISYFHDYQKQRFEVIE